MKDRRNAAVIISAVMLILVGGYFLYAELCGLPEEARILSLGKSTPIPYAEGADFSVDAAGDFTFTDQHGQQLNLFSHIGSPILLHFWNGDSESVVAELQALERAYRLYGDSVVFLSVHTKGTQSQDDARALFAREVPDMPIYFDEDGSALAICGSPLPPVTFFIDADGFIAAAADGSIDEDTLLFGLSLLADGPA